MNRFRTIVLGCLVAGSLVISAAPSFAEARHEQRHNVHHYRRDIRHDRRYVRADRRDHRNAMRHRRETWRRDRHEWQEHGRRD